MKMNQDIKQRWLSALRSGAYTQAKGALATEDGFCCLGVLCEIAVEDGVVVKSEGLYYSPTDSSDQSDTELPLAVQNWAGFNYLPQSAHSNPYVIVDLNADTEERHLSELNDDYGYDFSRLADVIEEQL